MKLHATELPNEKNTVQNIFNNPQKFFLLVLTLAILTMIPVCFNHSYSPLQPLSLKINVGGLRSKEIEKRCDIFRGQWIPYPKGPYYTNSTCSLTIDQQNCMKFGRPDTEFMKWRWKPDECELPLFDAVQFLELVRGKSMAFVGDSVGRNQVQSLLCLLASVVYPADISNTTDYSFRRWYYADYNFTLAVFWSPFLVRASDADPEGHSLNSLMSLYLDEADEAWTAQIESFDYVIISAGQWFFRPLIYYENDQSVKCHNCHIKNITAVTMYYGYRMAFRTAFRTLLSLKNYKGMTFLRSFSPSHFENGEWNKGGNCVRTRPFTSQEMKLDGFNMEFRLTQVEEFRAAEREGKMRGLRFGLLDTTEIMLLRPDGHPNHYGHSRHHNLTIADCVHWCLPGPIDTWNEFLLYMLKREDWRSVDWKLQKNA